MPARMCDRYRGVVFCFSELETRANVAVFVEEGGRHFTDWGGRKEIGTVRNDEVKKMYLSYFIIGYSLVFIVKNVNIYEFNFVRLQDLPGRLPVVAF